MTERVLVEILELDTDRCQNVYGMSPCTAGRVESGTAQAGASTTLTLRAGASAVDDAFNGMTIRLGDGRERRVLDYAGATKVATVLSRWATNLFVRSEEIDSGAWTKSSVTVTANAANDSDGASTLDLLTENTAATVIHSCWQSVASVNLNQSCVVTCEVRAAGRDKFYLLLFDGGATGNFVNGQFDIAAKTAVISLGGNGGSGVAQLEDLGGGLFRFKVRGIPNSAAGSGALRGELRLRNAAGAQSYTGDGMSGAYVGRFTAEQAGDFDAGYVKTGATAIGFPDATTGYTVIDRPNACYNTFRTCQDKPNFTKGTQTLRFTGQGSPIDPSSPARPFITAIDTAPTEIDPEEGLAQRAASSVAMVDAPDSDVGMDPYIADRATPAGGTYWTRFFARNQNYAGREARIKRGFATRSSGGTWTFGALTSERYIWESRVGPDQRGDVRIQLKDPLKLADRAKLPTPTSGKLLADVGPSDLVFPLNPGDGAQYDPAGYIRIGDEVIRYDSNVGDVISLSFSSYRAQFGTESGEYRADDSVQQCLVYIDQPYSTVIQDLLNRAGIDDADIDLVGLLAEDETWLGAPYRVTTCITDPDDITTYLAELLQQANAVMWWSPTQQKVKFQVVAPQSPSAVGAVTLNDSTHLMDGTVAVESLDDLRISFAAINFAIVSATANVDEAKNYKLAEVAVDIDAEADVEYSERRPRTIYSRWFGRDNILAMRTLVRRYVARYRDAPQQISFRVDPKDGALVEGALADVQTYRIVDEAGAVRSVRILITRREDGGKYVDYSGRLTNFDELYGFIGPDSTSDYPDNNGYAVIGDNSGLLSDGSDCSKII